MERIDLLNNLSVVRDKLRCLTILLHTLLIDGGGCDWLPMEANREAVHTFAMDIEDTVDSLLKG